MEEYIEIGQIVNTIGLKGELKVISFSDRPERFTNLKNIYVSKNGRYESLDIGATRVQKNVAVIKFKNIDTIEMAEKYKGLCVHIPKVQLEELPEGTYYVADLLGIKVFDESGELIGVLEEVNSYKANDVYSIKKEGKEILLPAISSVIKDIDIKNKKMVVCIPRGI